jgi:hypothetical protein
MEIMYHNTLDTLNRKLVACPIRKISLRNHSQLCLSHTCARTRGRGFEPFAILPTVLVGFDIMHFSNLSSL